MKPSRLAPFAVLLACPAFLAAADATAPVDYTDRNATFAPGRSNQPGKQKPATNSAVQEKRVEPSLVEKKSSSLAGQTAPIAVTESREKLVREKESQRPDKTTQPTSAYNQRPAAISTTGDATRPPTVAKYQDSLAAASATNMARFPAIDRATSAKINRFVFRKNPADDAVMAKGAAVIPAAGGSAPQK